MRFPLTKYFPIAPIQFALLVLVLHYLIYRPSWLTAGLLAGLLVLLGYRFVLKQVLKTLLLLVLFGYLFIYQKSQLEANQIKQPDRLSTVELIPDSIMVNGDHLSFIGRHSGCHYQLAYRMTSKEEADFFKQQSQFLKLKADIRLEEAAGLRNFKGFNHQAYLAYQGIFRVGKIKSLQSLKIISPRSISDRISQCRRQAIVWCQSRFPQPMSHYMTGLLFGYLDKSFGQMTELYSQLGIIHLFALSGMQVGFFLTYLRRGLVWLHLPIDKIKLLEVVCSFCYSGLTGHSISVIRSLLQAQLRHIGLTGLDNLAMTFLMMFLINGHFLMSIGGVLSFAYAFILATVRFEELSGNKQRLLKALAISFGIVPLLAYYFSVFNPISVVLTALLAYLFDGLILPGLAILFFFSPLAVVTAVNPFFLYLEKGIGMIGNYFSAPLVLGSPTALQLCLCMACLAIVYDYRGNRGLQLVAGGLLLLTLFTVKWPLINEVTLVDVGQGDSIFIRDKQNHTMLIDVGGVPAPQEKEQWQRKYQACNAHKTLIPYLRSRGVDTIDQLVLTHTDIDHVGDLEAVAEAFSIKQIYVSRGSLTNTRFVKRLQRLAIKVKAISAGDHLPIMGSFLEVLYPWELGDGKNNDSLVLYGRLLDKSFLFTGDLEAEGEERLIARYPKLRVDVLKAAHHGSKGSSIPAFLDHIQPQLSLISAGRNNQYQHPNLETLARFEARHIPYYSTASRGAIRLTGQAHWQLEVCR
ncbi:TPA: DNA internalization-related competence protein ComEC/Rec2 [Streptococcus equi subsp. zooepidemicus]|uniref:DNA internalization-related competence protein ComEC/Rec2 n=1 Tax=Streptococcus equi TaxID=1336 RepID=UPI0013F62496|nr:DNA internalization-related competence protein ComEC/Rec2 [Streptococcus equi]MDI5953431.1 DNA internalization-related competence protein ComEC/Rec2 [Streptococcus equi subsp. zooepidemicus]QTZ58544.1 ComE operon protein 3 [Streptococcus equi subsp. zooepidemicus]QUF63128.1 DNA internalization-related competence protein ComEC/Rec2 [Streptococcus equi subsp. zooepidemicus]QWN61726.1 DNA internalization-related competence protein ComEC/Rec2 [Streptococcus equi subsp. zooepidemicus]HEL0792660.